MPTPPKWAQDLTLQVAIDEGRGDLPVIIWRRRRHPGANWSPDSWRVKRLIYSSGVTYDTERPCRIVITAGTLRKDQKLVLLHELTHWLQPAREHHSPAFWDKAWVLYRRYRVPIRHARFREGTYRAGATAAYHRSLATNPSSFRQPADTRSERASGTRAAFSAG